jgi:hypothetical protein
VSCIWLDDGSIEPKHVAKFLTLITNLVCCVTDKTAVQLYPSYLAWRGNHIAARLGHFIEYALRKLGKCFNEN